MDSLLITINNSEDWSKVLTQDENFYYIFKVDSVLLKDLPDNTYLANQYYAKKSIDITNVEKRLLFKHKNTFMFSSYTYALFMEKGLESIKDEYTKHFNNEHGKELAEFIRLYNIFSFDQFNKQE